jgi:hypothetical protein
MRSEGHEADIVLVDYLLLMDTDNTNRKSQQERITSCVEGLNDLSNDFQRADGTRGVVVATVTQAKPHVRNKAKKETEDFAKGATGEEMTAYAAGINNSANYLYGMVESDELDDTFGSHRMICLKNRWDKSGQQYSIHTAFDRAIFHDHVKQERGEQQENPYGDVETDSDQDQDGD